MQSQFLVQHWGFDIRQVGLMSMLMGVSFVGSVGWARLADRRGWHRKVLATCTMLYALFSMFLFIPRQWLDDKAALLVVIVSLGVSNLCSGPLFPLIDAQVMGLLETEQREDMFGRMRIYGTIGHAIITILVAEAVERWGFQSMLWIMLVACLTLLLAVLLVVPAVKPARYQVLEEIEAQRTPPHKRSSSFSGTPLYPSNVFRRSSASMLHAQPAIYEFEPLHERSNGLFTDTRFIALLLLVLTTGLGRAVLSFFQPYYVAVVLGKGNRFVSLAIAGRVLSESMLFWVSKHLTDLLGLDWMLLCGLCTALLRLLGYTLMAQNLLPSTFLIVLGLELLKGASTGLSMTAAVHLANKIAPIDSVSTAQAVFSGVWQGVSMAAGGLLGALLVNGHHSDELHGLQCLFTGTSIFLSVILGLFVARALLLPRFLQSPVIGRL